MFFFFLLHLLFESLADDVADVNEIHLPAVSGMGRVDDNASAVGAESRVRVAAPFAFILRRQIKMPEWDDFTGRYVVKIDVLFSLIVRIGVVENPFIAGQVCAVAISCHYAFANDFDSVRTVFVKIESIAVRRMPCPGQYVLRIAPDKMRCFAVRIDDLNIRSIGFGGEHSRAETAQARCPPAVQEDKSRAVRVEQQVVEIVLGILRIAGDLSELGYLGKGYYQLPAARIKVDPKNAGIRWRRVIFVWVGQAGVAIAGPHVLNTPEIRRNSRPAVGADSINRVRQSSFFAALNIKDMAYEPVVLPVVPYNFVFRAGTPLEHTALLPAPGAALAQFCPLVALFQIDHPDLDNIIGFGAAMFEIDLHPERIPAGRVELQFVVIAEPVEFRPTSYSTNRWQSRRFRFGCTPEGWADQAS